MLKKNKNSFNLFLYLFFLFFMFLEMTLEEIIEQIYVNECMLLKFKNKYTMTQL